MNSRSLTLLLLLCVGQPVIAIEEESKIENVLLITMDGLRFQELFTGAERKLIDKEIGKVDNVDLTLQTFWHENPNQRRKLLMPFFWSTIATQGQVFGSPEHRSPSIVKNRRYFSYPGYNELLTGFADESIDSNDKNPNQNVTVLEWLAKKEEFSGRVAAFCSWDVFPFIINSKRSGIPVNAGWQPLEIFENETKKGAYSEFQAHLNRYWTSVRYDIFTFRGAYEYLKIKKPRLLYVALGETDDWAHAGRYDLYLSSARMNDDLIRQLWELVQSLDEYRNKTALVISTDHGRGDGREGWKDHGDELPGSEAIWIAVMGPGVGSIGIRKGAKTKQGQVASTVASLLGYDFQSHDSRIAPPLPLVRQAARRTGDD